MHFTCPHCGTHTTIVGRNKFESWGRILVTPSTLGDIGFGLTAIVCPNVECQKVTLTCSLTEALMGNSGYKEGAELFTWRLIPESEAKVLPPYVPAPIQEDYYEACRIRNLSPKASATLSRRCLQGMIRDFHKISKATLALEIAALEDVVPIDVWESIDAVRSVGNIGAHMERDINTIVPVDPDEAQLLITMIEQLIAEWYVQQEGRRVRSEKMKALAEEKQHARKPPPRAG